MKNKKGLAKFARPFVMCKNKNCLKII